jgi:flagellar basal body-associated protein FliL
MEPNVDKKSNGAFIGAVIVIIILVLGGLYVWQNQKAEISLPENETNEENTDQSSAVINAYNELVVFEEDLGNTDTSAEVNVDTLQ